MLHGSAISQHTYKLHTARLVYGGPSRTCLVN